MEITITISKNDLVGFLFIMGIAPIIFVLISKSIQNFKKKVGRTEKNNNFDI